MSHDPKLKEAMAEIFGVLKKHDIGGAITLVSPTHAEFRFCEDPSWSCARIEGATRVRFRAKAQDFKTQAEHKRTVELTIHLVAQIRDLAARTFTAFDSMFQQLEKIIDFEHRSYQGFEEHE